MDIKENYLVLHKETRQRRRKMISVLTVFSLIVAIIVFWWLKLTGITVTGEAFCNTDEHLHGSSCYEYTLICTDESEEHVHTEECMEETFVCEISEHTHTSKCYSNPEADKETAEIWEATFENDKLTDTAKDNILYIASTQVGYTESTLNYDTDENGVQHGYTRYGEWYGNPYGEWSTMFVSFCLNYGNIEGSDILQFSGAETMRLQWQEEGIFEDAAFHTAESGEIVFLDLDSDAAADMTGVVRDFTDGVVTAIIGDWENAVSEVPLTDTGIILGYGLTGNLTVAPQETTEEISGGEVEETTAASSEEETTVQVETTAQEESTAPDQYVDNELNHTHTLECYTFDGILACTEWGKIYPWDIDRESEDFRDKAVKYVTYLINQLPKISEFESKLNEYEQEEDYDGYESYYEQVYKLAMRAWVNYENLLLDLREEVPNKELVIEYKTYFDRTTYATTDTETVEFVNYYDEKTADETVLIYGSSVGDISKFGFYWWYTVVVDENEYGDLIVTEKYYTDLSDKSNLEPTTSRGFVLLAHNSVLSCSVGDKATVSFDYMNTSAGHDSSGYGTVTFEEYVKPTTVEKPVSEIQNGELSDTQVIKAGGTATSAEGDVEISKTIDGTDIENVFDITLTVRTETNVYSYLAEPDMAVVVVMDISETMNSEYPSGSTTSRYDAAVEAAENFINQFASVTSGISQLGFVSFNTSAQEILPLQPCTTDNAQALINEMKADTEAIINASGYDVSHERFTNVEAGLKRGYDMLKNSGNANQYIIFLSDGFPTTYLKNGTTTYEGYDPYTGSGTKGADGVFYDYVQGKYCTYGTSYSDKASIRAREMATTIKSSGAKIFSIGVDVGGQTIQYYSDDTINKSHSIVDRTSTTYEIGDASSEDAYKTWLGESIGSNYYFDSTNKTELETAFNDIFAEIKELNKQNRYTVWTSTDPLPVFDEKSSVVEFIHFYEKDGDAAASLTGELNPGAENTAYHEDGTIFWDLKNSGYTTTEETVDGATTTYYFYTVTYRVRLYNESDKFVEYEDYETNGNAYLKYKTIVNTNGTNEISDEKILNYPKPVVEGYVAGLDFIKQSDIGEPLAGATFTLTHDDISCGICHGNNKPVTTVNELTYTSTADGKVVFDKIPSGHIYTLDETVAPEGYVDNGKIYKVTITMDSLSVMMYNTEEDATNKVNGTAVTGDSMIITNPPFVYILPETGSVGTLPFTICGLCLMAIPLLYCIQRRRKERRAKL